MNFQNISLPAPTLAGIGPVLLPLNGTLDSDLQLNVERILAGGLPVERFTSYGYTVTGVVLTFVCVIATFAHVCIILTIIKNRPLRTPINWMLLNLSACIASITTLAVISVERYLLIGYPGKATITNRMTLLAVIAGQLHFLRFILLVRNVGLD
ncbi:hypothetical protein RvY_14869 [Ramazzottius varieornatus]|uniref:G-protein coupled receptors family 1 profile domain-containing protein n=1 Tax=Ramazzottius varieornatus TaxID=947166 RepID=A0A1D1VST0_RAMVA|nr:hypothetical protein RvY_14869 [Ramazzottius varieornatus]